MDHNVEWAVIRHDGQTRTAHLFDGRQPAAKTGDDTYTTLCGRTVKASRARISRNEPICQSCVRVENAHGKDY